MRSPWSLVHPLQAESSRPVFETVKPIHPGSLVWQRDLAEGEQRDSHAARDQSGDQFASVGPGAGHYIGSDENVQRTSVSMRNSAMGAGSS